MPVRNGIRVIARDVQRLCAAAESRIEALPGGTIALATARGLGQHDASHMAAGVAYYALLSLFPLILGMTAIYGLFLPSEAVQEDVLDFFEENVPTSLDAVRRNIDDVIRYRGAIGAISVVGLLWAGSAVFGAVNRAVNRAWGIHKDPPFYVKKLRDISMALSVGVLLLLSLGLTSLFSILRSADISVSSAAIDVVSRIVGFLITLAIFLLIYRYVPNTRVQWRDVWPGAGIAAVLFEMAKTLFVLYVAEIADYESIYGSMGSLVVLLVWVYVSAFTLLIGAEFSSQLARVRSNEPAGMEML